jgi:hypothetical protein
MQAALVRTETLEDENELLRSEIDRLRNDVEELREHAQKLEGTGEARALATDARSVLDRLEAASRRGDKLRVALDRSFTGTERPLDAVSPEPERAPSTVLEEKPERFMQQLAPLPEPPGALPWVLAASVVSFALGFFSAFALR